MKGTFRTKFNLKVNIDCADNQPFISFTSGGTVKHLPWFRADVELNRVWLFFRYFNGEESCIAAKDITKFI